MPYLSHEPAIRGPTHFARAKENQTRWVTNVPRARDAHYNIPKACSRKPPRVLQAAQHVTYMAVVRTAQIMHEARSDERKCGWGNTVPWQAGQRTGRLKKRRLVKALSPWPVRWGLILRKPYIGQCAAMLTNTKHMTSKPAKTKTSPHGLHEPSCTLLGRPRSSVNAHTVRAVRPRVPQRPQQTRLSRYQLRRHRPLRPRPAPARLQSGGRRNWPGSKNVPRFNLVVSHSHGVGLRAMCHAWSHRRWPTAFSTHALPAHGYRTLWLKPARGGRGRCDEVRQFHRTAEK